MNTINRIVKTGLLLVFLLPTLVLNAQVLIKSNDKSMRYDLVKPAHFFIKITIFDTTGKLIEKGVTENLVKIDSTNGEMLFIRSSQYPVGRLVMDSSIDNSSGCVKYIFTTNPLARREVVVFDKTSAHSHNFRKGVYTDKTAVMEDGYFDDTSIWNLFGYMPIKKGVKYYLNCYGSNNVVPLKYYVEYLFDEPLRDENGNMTDCRVLHLTYENTTDYLWIDKKSNVTLKEVSHSKSSTVVLERF